MKKVIISFLVALLSTTTLSAIDYRGFFDLKGGSYTSVFNATIGVSTTHGIQLNQNLYFGIGANLSLYPSDNDFDTGSHFALFGDIRYDMGLTKKWSPYIDLKLGSGLMKEYYFNHWAGDENKEIDGNMLLINPSVGARLRLSSKCGLNFGLSYIPFFYKTRAYTRGWDEDQSEYDYEEWKSSISNGLFFNIGIDF